MHCSIYIYIGICIYIYIFIYYSTITMLPGTEITMIQHALLVLLLYGTHAMVVAQMHGHDVTNTFHSDMFSCSGLRISTAPTQQHTSLL